MARRRAVWHCHDWNGPKKQTGPDPPGRSRPGELLPRDRRVSHPAAGPRSPLPPSVRFARPSPLRTSRPGSGLPHGARLLLGLVLVGVALLGCEEPADPDLNDDGVVNILDVSLAASCLGQVIPPPVVAITDPGDGSVVASTPISVSGTVDVSAAAQCRVADIDADGTVDESDFDFVSQAFGQVGFPVGAREAVTVTVNGLPADVLADTFSASVALVPGPNLIVARARDAGGHVGSDTITVTLATPNGPPVADAGPDQTVFVTDVVTLDGSASSDPDGDRLTFSWTLLDTPPGSAAALSDPGAVMPGFDVDLPGSYVAELVVNDGRQDSAPDTVTITTQNSAPVADAGPDQTVFVTETVTLDGSGSSDVDGDPLTFSWLLRVVPAGSAATLSDPGAVMPSFDVDLPGIYVAELVVNDGQEDSAPDTVSIDTQNSPPVADAGPDQTPPVGATVTLDGSGSSDVDGDPLSFFWALTATPEGSAAGLSDPRAVMPELVVDLPGIYAATLVVNDGLASSDPDSVTIATQNSPPVADAGPDQRPLAGESVTLDGSASSDVDGDLLSFDWSLTTRPAGSGATLSDASAVRPTFTVDLPGLYVAQLTVDDGRAKSAPDTVALDTTTAPPVADAGPDQTVDVGATVTLDGSGSSDVDGDRLGFQWSLTVVQPGSTATLENPTSVFPTFVADLPGTYVAQLIVNDGFSSSLPDSVTIDTVNSAPVADAGPDQTVLLTETAVLDGSGSSDADRDVLTRRWSFTARPPGSQALLSNREAEMPTFVVDQLGTYVVQLIVDDGKVSSAPDTVVLSTINSAPVADAGADQSVFVTETVTLDGSLSFDVDGDPLAYRWALTAAPASSTATLQDPFSVAPSFTVDRPGTYVAQLIVSDGIVESRPNSAVIVTDNSPPIANAGFDQRVPFGSTVTLDASGSSDADGDPLTFSWELLVVPPGSTATLSDASAEMPTFVADAAGDYVARLVVNDGGLDSAPDTVDIAVDPLPGILVPDGVVGAALQSFESASLEVTNHGGVLVRVESSDPSLVLVSPDASSAGSGALEVFVPDGSADVDYVVQGVAGASGAATLTVSAAGFGEGRGEIMVVQPGVALTALADSLPLGVEDAFEVLIGVPDAAGFGLSELQDASAANVPPLAVTVTSSEPGVGELFATGPPAASLTLEIPSGTFQVELGFRSLGGGTTTVSASLPGFVSTTLASVDVSVELPLITTFPSRVGAGLQVAGNATLGVADHGGVLVRIESSLPAVALVSADAATAGSPAIEIFVPNGSNDVDYVVQGVAGRVGASTLVISAPGFAEGRSDVTVVQPGLALFALSSSASIGTDDPFSVFTGLPDGAGTGLTTFQPISAANVPPLVLTVTSSEGSIGQLSLDGTTAATVMGTPETGRFQTALVFTPLAVGVTTVSASIPQFLTTNAGSVEVDVAPPGIGLFSQTIGAGLQRGDDATLDVSNHGGVLVRIESDDPSRARIAPDADTPGTDFIEVFVPDGSSRASYVVQGVAGATGAVTVTASAAGFADAAATVTVVQPTVVVSALSESREVGDDDAFTVLIGLPNAGQTGLSSLQGLSAGNVPPLVLTLTSSEPTVGELTIDGTSGGSVAIEPAPGTFQLSAIFAPLAPGTTTVEATIPGFLQIGPSAQTVTVTGP